ncbi:MAG TPA: O-antigen ligase family protein [Niastella sp.]|nr:O-antigen ligase family protein [Niastella sp.]
MKLFYPSYQKSTVLNVLLIVLLSAVAIGISYSLVQFGNKVGIVILALLAGLSLVIGAILNPVFGFYASIVLGFTITVGERIFYGVLTLDFMIEIMVYATFIGVLIRNRTRHESLWKKAAHPITYAYIAFFIFTILEVLNPHGTSLAGNLFHIRRTIQFLLLYFIAIDVFYSYKRINYYFYFWIVIAALCGAYGCYQQWVGFTPFEERWLFADEARMALYKLDNGTYRKFSSLTDPAAYGIVMACSVMLTLVLFLKMPLKQNRLKMCLALVFLLLGMSYSGTRTAVFALVVGTALYILMTINNIRTLVFAVFCSLALGFLLLAPIYGNVTVNRLRSAFKFSTNSSYQVRNINRARIQPYILANPIGGGVLTSGVNGLKYNPNHYLAGFPPDSGYLRYALETGWIGLIFVCLLYFIILQQGVHAYYTIRRPVARAYLIAAVVTLFAYVLCQYSQVTGQSPQFLLFYPLIAIIIRISKLEKKVERTL